MTFTPPILPTPPQCPYCGGTAAKVSGKELYPNRRDLWTKTLWHCQPCAAWVGCHGATDNPLGRLANAELRQWKIRAHNAFDDLWRTVDEKQRALKRPRGMDSDTRSLAYGWLAQTLKLKPEKCHIGQFDIDMCKRVVEICIAARGTIPPQPHEVEHAIKAWNVEESFE